MSEEAPEKKVRLTANDPVPRESLAELERLDQARAQVAEHFLSQEENKISLLAASKRIRDQRVRAFDEILTERGIAPGTSVNIDTRTGQITVLGPDGLVKPAEEEPKAEPEAASDDKAEPEAAPDDQDKAEKPEA